MTIEASDVNEIYCVTITKNMNDLDIEKYTITDHEETIISVMFQAVLILVAKVSQVKEKKF